MRLEPSDIAELKPLIESVVKTVLEQLQQEQQTTATNGHREMPSRLTYSEAEAAALLGLEPHHLREQRKLRRIGWCRGPGRRILYRTSHIEEYLARKEQKAEPMQ